MLAVFDFDGTLVDSRNVVEQAYEDIGYPMPASAWGKPGNMWLPPEHADELRDLKNQRYRELITTAKELPPATVARELRDVGVLTATAEPACGARLDALDIEWFFMGFGQDAASKSVQLRRYADHGVYIDDLPVGEDICRSAGPGWHFIRYWGQSAKQLWTELGDHL